VEDAVFWVLIFVSIWALPFGIFGAAPGGRRRNAPDRRETLAARYLS
jgi:hypothetical protein